MAAAAIATAAAGAAAAVARGCPYSYFVFNGKRYWRSNWRIHLARRLRDACVEYSSAYDLSKT